MKIPNKVKKIGREDLKIEAWVVPIIDGRTAIIANTIISKISSKTPIPKAS
jgi:hypothetical protein